MEELYTMSQTEINRLEVIQKLLTKQWKQEKAAQVLHISGCSRISLSQHPGGSCLIWKKQFQLFAIIGAPELF